MLPFFCHWYVGVPPFVGVAVKVTDALAHGVASPDIDTEGVTFCVTVSVIVLLVTGLVVVQDAVLVITTLITSLLFKDVVA